MTSPSAVAAPAAVTAKEALKDSFWFFVLLFFEEGRAQLVLCGSSRRGKTRHGVVTLSAFER